MNEPGLIAIQMDEPARKPELARHIAHEGGVKTISWTASELASATTKRVCHSCNTGWMSNLEGRAKPTLKPLIKGQGTILDTNQLFVISSWAAKTSIAFESTQSENSDGFTADECTIVMKQDRPPASCQVFIAAIAGLVTPMQYSASQFRMEVGGVEICKFHFHTIQVGALVLQVLRRLPPPSNYGSLERFAIPREIEVPFDVAAVIFPPTGKCKWPPAKVLGWEGLFALSTRNAQLPTGWHVLTDPTVPPSRKAD